MEARSDAELLLASRSDPHAFELLYGRLVGATVRFAARRSNAPEEVVDLVATIWLEVVASIDRYDPARGDALPWILGIAANLCGADARRRAREQEAIRRLIGRRVIADDDFARLEREIDAEAVAPRVRDALAALPPAERAVAELVFLDGLSPADTAAALRIRPAAARMRLARARRKLRDRMAEPAPFIATDPIEEVFP